MDGALALDAAWLFAAFLIVLLLAATGIAARRFLLERGGGTVECGLRRLSGSGAWRLGVASYQRDELRWYHVFGILLRPEEIFPRRTLIVISRRLPEPSEEASFGPGRVVVECRAGDDGGYVELAMSESALTGFLSWLEAAPPGSHLDQIALRPTRDHRSPSRGRCRKAFPRKRQRRMTSQPGKLILLPTNSSHTRGRGQGCASIL